jgi:hypothetical protein
MNIDLKLQKNLIIFGIPLLIVGIVLAISKSPIFIANPNSLSIGIIFDLLLTVPLVYFLLIRKTNIPKTTVVPFLIFGVITCSFILPTEHQTYLSLFKIWVLPVVEISILSFVIFNVRKGIKSYRLNKNESLDFFTTLKSTCYEILPKGIVMPVVTEMAVFYYGFLNWRKRELKNNEFTYHKDSGTIALLIVVIFIVAIETLVIHILVQRWNNTVAWILTFLSIYSAIQILGLLRSMPKRPISIENGKLYLRYGIMNETTIEFNNIESVELSSKDIVSTKGTRRLSILGELESHNLVIRLKEDNTMYGLYGIKRKYKVLALYVDNKKEFQNQVNKYIQ